MQNSTEVVELGKFVTWLTQISAKLNHRFLSLCRSGGNGLRLTRTEVNRLVPDALFIELFIFLKMNDIKSWLKLYIFIYYIYYMVKVWQGFRVGWYMVGNLRVGWYMFVKFEELEGISLWGLEIINW
jgi:hypothetical protein